MFRACVWVVCAIMVTLMACVPNKPKSNIDFSLDLSDSEIQKAFEAGYMRSYDTLNRMFKDPNPTIRYLALMSFASNHDSTRIDSIVPLLKDADENVRVTAAFTLGQIGSSKAELPLIQSFQTFDSLNRNQLFNATILESLGKCGSMNTLKQIASVKSYRYTDSLLVIGQSKSLYRFANRNIVIPEGTKRALELLTDVEYPYTSRLYAAHYFSRATIGDLKNYDDELINIYKAENHTLIKLPLITAIAKTKTESAFNFLSGELQSSSNGQIRYAILSNLNQFSYTLADTIAFDAIKFKDVQLARAAGNYLIEYGQIVDAKKYFNLFLDSTVNKGAHIELLTAINKFMPYTAENMKNSVNQILKDSLTKVADVYRKADAIKGLAWDVTNFQFIRNATYKSPDKILNVTGLEAMETILGNPNFARIYKSNYIPYKKQIFSYLIDGILSGDVGLVSTAAIAMRNPSLGLKTFFPSDSLFQVSLRKLKLPEAGEAYMELSKTIAYWRDASEKPVPEKGFRMMDWAVLNNTTDSTLCEIQTSKGLVTMRLLPSVAPMTVANWIELVKSNYFNGKPWHRVVPNFVVQSGCNRGDGYSTLSYVIRSEFSMLNYTKPGLIGMASIGPNTESNQFFITLSATPWLDGRYTIFAEVVNGLDIVSQLSRGDKILKITIKK